MVHVPKVVKEVVEAIIPSWTISTGTWNGFETPKLEFTIPIPRKQLKGLTPRRGGKMEVHVEGEVTPSFQMDFDPGVQLDITASLLPNLSKFTLNLDSRVEAEVGLDAQLTVGIESWNGKKGDELSRNLRLATTGTEVALNTLAKALRSDPDFTPGAAWKRTVFKSKPFVQTIAVGPVPVVFVGRFKLDAGCSFGAKGNLKFSSSAKVQVNTKMSLEYYPLLPISAPIPGNLGFSAAASGDWNITGGAEAQFECYILPTAEVSVYDALSVEVGPRISPFVAKVKAESECPNTYHPASFTPQSKVELEVFGAVTAQGSLKVSPPGVSEPGIEVGPIALGQWKESYWGPKEFNFDTGLGYCTPQCKDGTENGTETDVDCGGEACGKCAEDKDCKVNSDCIEGTCRAGVCNNDPCFNEVQDGDETDVDCGGKCGKCANDKKCKLDNDCTSSSCSVSGSCVANTCLDERASADECGIDCGGSVCGSKCAVAVPCADATQCTSGWSNGIACVETHCQDRQKNEDESDIDCGGDNCSACPIGKACSDGPDCHSTFCSVTNICATQCTDGVKNEDETDVDCGGSTCAPCGNGGACLAGSDCTSTVCIGNSCSVAGSTCNTNADCDGLSACLGGICNANTCQNNVQDPAETDLDCGFVCLEKCDESKACEQDRDCRQGLSCLNNLCEITSCQNGVKDPRETDVDCGGDICVSKKCAEGKACQLASDCMAGLACDNNVCTMNLCGDGIKNQDESDIDCGGATCAKCDVAKSCTLDSDCATDDCECGVNSGNCTGDTGQCGAGKWVYDQPTTDGSTPSGTLTIPAQCNQVYIQAWGAAGSSGDSGMGIIGAPGGAGGFVSGIQTVAQNDVISAWVGQGGSTDTTPGTPGIGSNVGVITSGGTGDSDLFAGGGGSGGGLTSVGFSGSTMTTFIVPGGGAGSAFAEGEDVSAFGGGGALGADGESASINSQEGGGGAGAQGGSLGMAGTYGALPNGFTSADGLDGMPANTGNSDYSSCAGLDAMTGAGAIDMSFSQSGDGCVVVRCISP